MNVKGLVHVYTGNGKGKTTAAVGLGMRAFGRGKKVLMVQFLKGAETGELVTAEKLGRNFTIYRGKEIKKFTWNMSQTELEETRQLQQAIFKYSLDSVVNNDWDILILDEIMAAITTGMVGLEQVADFIKSKPQKLEVVLTGRNAPTQLLELADYISEIKAVKHPMEKGIPARIGIES